MIRVQAICGFGVGSSMLLKIKLQSVFDALGISANITTGDVTSASSASCDVIFTSDELSEILEKRVDIPVIVINSFVNVNEITEKVKKFLEEYKGEE